MSRWETARTRASSRWDALPAALKGSFWMLGSALLFVVMASLVKFLGQGMHPVQVAFFRSLTGLFIIVPLIARSGMGGFKTTRPRLHLARGICGSLGMMCGFYAFTYLPLADATAISFARALFLVPLAIVILSEVVGLRRWAATLVGFLGVLIILRPSGSTDPAALVAVAHALFVALALTCVKLLSRTDQALTLLLYSGLIGTVMTAIPTVLLWHPPTLEEYLLLGLMGLVGLAAHNCLVRAYAEADATALAPLDYTRLLFATAAGFLFFADIPDLWTILGAAIIVASTLYITIREARVSGARRLEAETRPTGPDV